MRISDLHNLCDPRGAGVWQFFILGCYLLSIGGVSRVVEIFHIPTLMACLAAGLSVIAIFVMASWSREPARVELGCWSIGYCLGAAGVVLSGLRDSLPLWLTIGIGNTMMLLSVSLFWIGLRLFDRRPIHWSAALPGPAIWMLLYFSVPAFANSLDARIIVSSVIVALYSLMVAWQGWRGGRSEPLPARRLITVFFCAHAMTHVARIGLVLTEPGAEAGLFPGWYGLLMFELFVLSLLSGLSIFMLIRDRLEADYRRAAEIDLLTGIFNRRAFISVVERVRKATAYDGALALLDIDHFKRINDTYGHGGGDEALKHFCRLVEARLDPGMAFGRIGGEEFAIHLPGFDLERARIFCEDLRQSIDDAVMLMGTQQLKMSVSIGLSADLASYADITFLLGIADRGLYISKRNGRNRVTALNAGAGLKLIATLMAEAGQVSVRPGAGRRQKGRDRDPA